MLQIVVLRRIKKIPNPDASVIFEILFRRGLEAMRKRRLDRSIQSGRFGERVAGFGLGFIGQLDSGCCVRRDCYRLCGVDQTHQA